MNGAHAKRKSARDYQPTPEEKEWARLVLASTSEGGTLMTPARMLWRVSHERKTVILINSNRLETRIGREAYLRVKGTFEKVGYLVAPA